MFFKSLEQNSLFSLNKKYVKTAGHTTTHNCHHIQSIYGERNGNPLQYSCLENPMDRRALQPAVHEVAKSQT